MDTQQMMIALIIVLLLARMMRGRNEGYAESDVVEQTADPVGLGYQNPNASWQSGWMSDDNPARADVSYGLVLQDPFIRKQESTIPTIYTNRHLTEKELQSVDYVPRRIRPPTGLVGWGGPNPSPLVQEMRDAGMSKGMQWHTLLRLGMPSEFW